MQIPGIDIVKVSRMKLDKTFITKILSENEILFLNKINNEQKKLEFLAGRWAAKEAIYKVYNHSMNWNLIEIQSENCQPFIVNEDLQNIRISISHEEEYAVAIAILNE